MSAASYTGVVLLLCLAVISKGQERVDCEPLRIEDLGSTTTSSNTGLLSTIIDIGEAVPAFQVFAMSTVCASIPNERGRFEFVSVVVNYTNDNRPNDGVQVGQFEFMCSEGGNWINNVFNRPSRTIPSSATFDTLLRTDCAVCIEPSQSSDFANSYDPIAHCVICEGCEGLNQCSRQQCCNYYKDDQCLAQCPQNSTVNATTNDCVCNSGLTGEQCEMDIDECTTDPNPCLNNGSCNNTQGSFICQCTSMYTGDLCEEDVDECTNGVAQCVNGATCNNTFGGFECLCPPTYTGAVCDIDVDECIIGIAQCMNGATCNNTDGGFACVCPPEFTGAQCETDIDECAMGTHNCTIGAVCNNTQGGYDCICTAEFTGTFCEIDIDECNTNNPCKNNADCENIVGGFTCNCTSGFEGMTCENDIDECSAANSPCENNGICINNVGGFSCNCTSGFEGSTCGDNIDECDENPCGVGGQCIDTIGSYTCDCDSGFVGTTMCENFDECASISNPCSGRGNCTDTIGSFDCMCMPGYTGQTCNEDIDECMADTNPCLNNGTCANDEGSYKCDCLAGFEGDNCADDIDECQDFTQFCMSGTCENTFGGFVCNCPIGTTGQICDTDINECTETPNLCQNSGSCSNSDGSFSCNCPSGYSGNLCETDIDECALNNPCQNGGTCSNTQGSYQCLCRNRWDGPNCEDCSISNCVMCTGVDAVCQQCETGYDLSFSQTVCVERMPCEPECVNGECLNGQCDCEIGYTGNDCSELCTSRIAGCEICSFSQNTPICDQCQAGLIKDGNECKIAECKVPFCEECSEDNSVCTKCVIGYEMKEPQAACTLIDQQPLTNLEIIGIIIGSILFAVGLIAFIACIVFGIYRAKEQPKMNKAPKKSVFQKYAANTNPLYLDSKKTVGLAAAHRGVSAEAMMSIEYNAPGYDSRDEHDDFSSLSVVDETVEFQYDQEADADENEQSELDADN